MRDIAKYYPERRLALKDILSELSEDEKKVYTLTKNLWNYLYHYALKHQSKGNGFGFGLVDPLDEKITTRTLSARYYKDGSEILVNQYGLEKEYLEKNKKAAIEKNTERHQYALNSGLGKMSLMEKNGTSLPLEDYKLCIKGAEAEYDEKYGRYSKEFDPTYKTPRRLTPKECAILMGFEKPMQFRTLSKDNNFRLVCADNRSYKQFGNSVVVPVFRAVAQLLVPIIEKTDINHC